MFAHVTRNVVDQLVPTLPTVWDWGDRTSTSGFDLLDPATQRAAGWYPVIEARAPLGPDQVHGPPVFTIGATTVTATYPAVADTPDNINTRTIVAGLTAALEPGSPARTAIATNTTFINAVKPGTAAGQASAAYDQARQLAQQNNVIIANLLRLARLALGRLDAPS